MNQLKSGVLLSFLSMALMTGVSLVYMPVMLRILGQSEYGLYSLVASVVNYLSLLSFGFGGAYIRYFARATTSGCAEDLAKLNGLFLLVFAAIGAVAASTGVLLIMNVGLVFGDRVSAEDLATVRVLVGLMTFSSAVSFPASVFGGFIVAKERFVFQRLLQVFQTVAAPILTVSVLLMGYRSIGMAAVAAGMTVSTAAVNICFSLRRLKMKVSFQGLDLHLMKEVALFSSFIWVNMLVDQVNWNVDKFILGRVSGAAAVAVYALAGQLNVYYMTLGCAVSAVFIPRVNQMVAAACSDKEITNLFSRVGRIQFLVLTLASSGLIVFGRPFISMWAGGDYSGSYPILLLMILPVTISLIQNLGLEIQRAKNKHRFLAFVYLGMAVLNVSLSIPLAQRYGGIGAAIGTSISFFVGNGLIMNLYYQRRVGLNIHYFWGQILRFVPALVPVVLTGIAMMSLVNLYDAYNFLACALVFVIVYCSSMWFFGMNDYERRLISRPVLTALQRARSGLR